MRIAICDDNPIDLEAIEKAVHTFDSGNHLEVYTFSRAVDLYLSEKRKKFDIAILDIEMEPPNGYDIAKKLVEGNSAPIIIFLTISMAYTLRGYGVAFRYLTKPIDQSQLNDALSAAIKEASAKKFIFSADGSSYIIPMEDIFYFEVLNHYTTLHTIDQSYTFRATLKEILSDLPAGYFGTPHHSYIVNLTHIKTATTQQLHLTNGMVVPVSRRRQKEFEKQLYAYLGR